ncbi:uncharacterized protein LOC106168879 [Lingula anatina]|uniref:Uncharacterized protein LOC106168879 n=1 Tax=Lingula anatina TaxID=7574 RepID=A0A1S3J1A0_LINAN|nr:uncharacterized protein LOC106168879 [Lingula anatina]|eukprot:XP_013403579.1 uncharacterized protein LOC106168879 [Lingula anatina]
MLKIALLLCVVGLAVCSQMYQDCVSYDPHMSRRCGQCVQSYHQSFYCPNEYNPGGSYHQKVPTHVKDGYGYKVSYRYETVYYGPSKKLYFRYADDPACYWQCDTEGNASLRACPYGTTFNEYNGVCQ